MTIIKDFVIHFEVDTEDYDGDIETMVEDFEVNEIPDLLERIYNYVEKKMEEEE